jgi:type II secretory pathway component PulF
MSETQFHYSAVTTDGRTTAGEIEATDLDHALALLTASGLRSVQVVALPATKKPGGTSSDPARPRPVPLSAGELLRLAEHLEMLARSGLPLSPGLRAAAEEQSHRHLAQSLVELARQLEMGRSLDQVLASQPQMVPGHLSRLIEAGLQSGTLAEVLTQLLDIDRSSRDMWRSVRLAISYPLVLLVGYVALVVFLGVFVLPGLSDVYEGVGPLPMSTSVLLWFAGDRLLVTVGIAVAAVPMLMLMFRALLSPVGHWRLLTKIPFLGPMLLWRSVATWTRLLGLFLENDIPAPEALRFAADGISDANVAAESRRIAQLTAVGRPLAEAVAAMRRLPASLVPIVRWGENAGALPEALRAAGEMFENRVRVRATFLQSALPPIMFIFVALGVLALLNALIAPMVNMVSTFM